MNALRRISGGGKIFFAVILAVIAIFCAGYYINSERVTVDAGRELMTLLPEYRRKTAHNIQLMKIIRSGVNQHYSRVQTSASEIEKLMKIIKFKLDVTPNKSLLQLSLASMQIKDLSDKIRQFEDLIAQLNIFYENSAREMSETKAFFDQLTSDKNIWNKLSPQEMQEITQCRNDMEELKTEFDAGKKTLAPLNELSNKVIVQLKELNEYGDNRRSEAFEDCFTAQLLTLPNVLDFGMYPFKFWLENIGETFKTVLPMNLKYLFQITLLLILINIPLFLLAKYWLIDFLRRKMPHGAGYTGKFVLPMGILLLGGGAAVSSSQFLVSSVMASTLVQIGYFIINLGCLNLALAFRVERNIWPQCYRLYFPLIFATLSAKLLYILLIQYEALAILLPILCLIAAIWLGWLLCRNHYPVLDSVIGILTVMVFLGAGYTAFFGGAYIGFTALLIWFSRLVQFQMALALTELILHSINSSPKKRHMNNICKSLIIPALWLAMLWSLFSIFISTYHLSDWEELLHKKLPISEQFCTFSVYDLIIIVVGFFITKLLIGLGRDLVRDIYQDNADAGAISSVLTLGVYVAWACYIISVLLILKVNTSSILIVIGGLSMGAGFAMKDVLENFVAGIILLAGQNVRPGDIIEFDGIIGRVKTVNIRATVVECDDGSIITLPNTGVIDKNFRNWTRNNPYMRQTIPVDVGYTADLDLVRKIMLQVAQSMPEICKTPKPAIICTTLGESGITMLAVVWMRADHKYTASSRYLELVVSEFRKADIEIPFPQLDIHLNNPPVNAETV